MDCMYNDLVHDHNVFTGHCSNTHNDRQTLIVLNDVFLKPKKVNLLIRLTLFGILCQIMVWVSMSVWHVLL